jgi:transposase InsO family protein
LQPSTWCDNLGEAAQADLEAPAAWFGDFKHKQNHRHRKSALGYRTPAEYAAACRHTHTPVACEIY